MLKKIFSLLLLCCLSHQISSQVIMERLSSVKANDNFDFEIRGSLDGKMDLFVLRVNPDSAENFVVFIRTQKSWMLFTDIFFVLDTGVSKMINQSFFKARGH
jgi:hypothetical protein